MRKLKTLMIELIICGTIGAICGGYGLLIWGKASDCPGGMSNAQEMASVKIYQGQWIEDIQKIGDYWSVGFIQRDAIGK